MTLLAQAASFWIVAMHELEGRKMQIDAEIPRKKNPTEGALWACRRQTLIWIKKKKKKLKALPVFIKYSDNCWPIKLAVFEDYSQI